MTFLQGDAYLCSLVLSRAYLSGYVTLSSLIAVQISSDIALLC